MCSTTTLVAVVLLVPPVLASISPSVLHESCWHIPYRWSHHSKYPSNSIIPLHIGLIQPNINLIGALLDEVSHPDSLSYGIHWMAEQVAAKFAPDLDTVESVIDWLVDSGFERERVRVPGSHIWIGKCFKTHVGKYPFPLRFPIMLKPRSACTAYHVPAHVQPHVDLITPTVHFNAGPGKNSAFQKLDLRKADLNSTSRAKASAPLVAAPPVKPVPVAQTITPACLCALYGLNYIIKSAAHNSYGIVEYTPQAYLASDIDNFAKSYAADLVGKRPVLQAIDGGVVQTENQGSDYNGESNLDLQYGMALITGAQPVTLYQVGDTIEGASFNDFVNALDGRYCTYNGGDDLSQDAVYPNPRAVCVSPSGGYQGPKAAIADGPTPPVNVISTSYAYNEHDLTPFYTARQCNEYAKLGLMGVTILYSSGDYGVAGNGGQCINPDGSYSSSGPIFNPSFPSTCPYVTAVGATQVLLGHTVTNPKTAYQLGIYSGGGFSNYFSRPAYQQKQVSDYLAKYAPPCTAAQYNRTGKSRAFPDLSANGANYVVSIQNTFYLLYGTSASTPVVGAILTLIYDTRLNMGKSPIGFINPTIYSDRFVSAFNNVMNGTNPGCGTKGFSAAKGWDPVTGLGTPNFPKLLAKWLELR
ncbi:peptidase S8/S53 domain-containing protein [Mycena epipterygia]|nr:peptidase S8/S53 domain-containing protein [Mycena epipterygia]